MKVVQINAVCDHGSTGRICSEISDSLFKHKIDNYIFFGVGNTQRINAEKFNTDTDIRIHSMMARITGLQAYFSLSKTKKILSRLDEIKPDIVHLHNIHANYIDLPMLLKYLAKKDVATVITLHDCWLFTGKCTHYTMDGCYKWQIGCNHCDKLKNDIPSWFFDRTFKMWSDKKRLFGAIPRLAVIGVSDWITNEARQSFLCNASVIRRIYNWIDMNAFTPRESDIRRKYNIPEDKFMILSVSSGWNENSERYKDAIKLSRLINDNMQIVLVGGGLIKERLPKNILCIDYIDGKDKLAEMYSTADAYVHFSREDTFGKVVAEAMACGTPAVVYDSTALPELVADRCGYVIPCGDTQKIYEKLRQIQSNTKRKYTEYCISNVRSRFNKETLINDTISLYKDMIKG